MIFWLKKISSATCDVRIIYTDVFDPFKFRIVLFLCALSTKVSLNTVQIGHLSVKRL